MPDTLAKAAIVGAAYAPDKTTTALRTAGIAIAGSGLVALCAHISLPLLFSPVPLTMQPFAVLLLALLLGPGVAFSTLALYLAEGAAGLPVFTPHGVGGMVQLLGPTGGYLLSYPFVAAMVSWLARRGNPRFITRVWAAATGNVLLLLCGALWLALLTHANARTIVNTSVLPFLPGDTLKVIAAAALATAWMCFSTRQSQCGIDGSNFRK
jgi:biotin transport system substrate-specific component